MKNPPGFDVTLACQTLTRIGHPGSIPSIIESGVGGRFIHPCLTYFIDGAIMGPTTLKLVAEEMHRKSNRSTVITSLARHQADGIRAAIAVDNMRQKSKKYVEDGGGCLVWEIVSEQNRRGWLGTIVKGLEPKDLETFAQLTKPAEAASDGVPEAARACIAKAYELVKNAASAAGKVVPKRIGTKALSYAPFCPTQFKGKP